MLKSLAITLIGADRPGLVSLVSDIAARHGANWLDSHLVNLGGQFAGIVHFHVPTAEVDTLLADFRQLESAGLQLSHAIGTIEDASDDTRRVMTLEVTGPDHAGIVQGISVALAELGVSIENFDSRSFSASMSGEALFEAHASLKVPPGTTPDTLYAALESLSDGLMVDIELVGEAEALPQPVAALS